VKENQTLFQEGLRRDSSHRPKGRGVKSLCQRVKIDGRRAFRQKDKPAKGKERVGGGSEKAIKRD